MIFKEYLRLEKIKRLHSFVEDIKKDFGLTVPLGTGFTRSEMFHFGLVEGKKFVHKESMKFLMTNGYTYDIRLKHDDQLRIKSEAKEFFETHVERMFSFFRQDINSYEIYPEFLDESPSFFVFKYYDGDWENIYRLNREDCRYIKKNFVRSFRGTKEAVTPFYNQMAHKLVKNKRTGEIKMVDLKRLEFHPQGDLAIYMYTDVVNDLYLLDLRLASKKRIIEPFLKDYPAQNAIIHRYYDWF